ncbi:TIGR00725 family protein [Azospirillum sp. ST 5-10]|uniref:TIGR00725 family protein n=1 Tax=unclassified Azospirillum TaxID=2630922 RepID=UPI003F49F4B5
MTARLLLSSARNSLHHDGRRFDRRALDWGAAEAVPDDAVPVDAAGAVRWAYAQPGVPRVPIGVIGPREATAAQLAAAERVGRVLGEWGVPVVCGGRGGVMEAVCRGCAEAGGLAIGVLPDARWSTANEHVAIPIATGLGEARNAVIARASLALVAIGGSYGTLSEIAFGLHFGRPVFLLEGAYAIPGAVPCADAEEALAGVARAILRLSA